MGVGQKYRGRFTRLIGPERFIAGDGINFFFTPKAVVTLIALVEILRERAEVLLREAISGEGNGTIIFVERFRIAQLKRGPFKPLLV